MDNQQIQIEGDLLIEKHKSNHIVPPTFTSSNRKYCEKLPIKSAIISVEFAIKFCKRTLDYIPDCLSIKDVYQPIHNRIHELDKIKQYLQSKLK